jgi:hypothetical protein
MVGSKTLDLPRSADDEFDGREWEGLRSTLRSRIDCLEQILRAFHDMADRDDIHQAANRLALVQEWIQDEAKRAAADPIFFDLRLV